MNCANYSQVREKIKNKVLPDSLPKFAAVY